MAFTSTLDRRTTLIVLFLQFPLTWTSETNTNWFGLGDSECFGKTCKFDQFCSKDPLYRSCRPCDEVTAWCDVNVTHMMYDIPSCYFTCERLAVERLQKELDGRPILDTLHVILLIVIGCLVIWPAVVFPVCRRFRRKNKRLQSGSDVEVGTMPTSASRTSLASNSELQHPPETSPPNGDDDPPISAMSPRAEDQQPLLPTAPDLPDGNADDESNTSDVGTASDDQSINIGHDDNGSLNDIEININDTDSGVVAGEGRGSRSGSGSRSSSRSMSEPVHLPIQIQDGVNNYLLMTTVDSETDHSIGHSLDISL